MTDFIVKFFAEYMVYLLVLLAGGLFLLELIKSKKPERLRKVVFVALAMATSFAIGQAAHLAPVETTRPYEEREYANNTKFCQDVRGNRILISQPESKCWQPSVPLVKHSDDSPFPSDHTLLAFASAFMVLVMTRYRKWGIALLVLACTVSAGRLVALVHSPLDIAGGVVIAAVGMLWYLLYFKKFRLPIRLAKE
jgi:membrane-associated phospholipid phosphatase